MTLKDYVEIVDNPVVMAIEEKDGTQLYKGYKGCFEFKDNKEILEREVARFHLRIRHWLKNMDFSVAVMKMLKEYKTKIKDEKKWRF